MAQSATRSTVHEYLAAFNDRDDETLQSLVADDVVVHGVHDVTSGRQSVIDHMERHFAAFPDYSGERHTVVHDDDIVSVRYTARGTHTGEYKGVEPTELPVSWTGMAMYRVDDGEIVEIWIEEDRLGLLEQLKVIETTEPAHLRI